MQFLDFFQFDFFQESLIQNKLKIHIETGNIFFNNLGTNESIYDFFQKQENTEKVNIHSDEFTFTDSYEDYFEWLIHGFKQGDDQNMMFQQIKIQNIYFIDLTIIYTVC